MGKFSLLTTLSLNAAGFETGINKAKQSTQDFKKGSEAASKAIGNSFSDLSGILGGAVNSQLGALGSSIKSGIVAFKAMIPAIHGVRLAIISTGIGAIVVAIGLAFAALTSYLTGTEDGAEKLNVIMGYLKGTFNVVMKYVNQLGEAIYKVFTGDFNFKKLFADIGNGLLALVKRVMSLGSALMKLQMGDFQGMKEDFNKAFGGLFDGAKDVINEINEGAKEGIDLGKEANQLKRDKIKAQKEIIDLQVRETELEVLMTNKNLSRVKQQEALNEKRKIGEKLDNIELGLLQREYNLQEKINASKGKSIVNEDREKLNDLYKSLGDKKREILSGEKIENRTEFKLANEKVEATKTFIEVKENQIKTLEATRESLYAEGKSIDYVTGKIMFLKKEIQDFNDKTSSLEKGLTLDLSIGDSLSTDIESIHDQIDRELNANPIVIEPVLAPIPVNYMEALNEQLKSTEFITSMASNAIQSLGDNIIAMAEGGEASFKDMIGSMIGGLRSVIYGLLAQALAQTIINALNPKNPGNQMTFGLAGIAAAAVGVTAVSALWSKLPKFAEGGIVGGQQFSGDNLIARVNSGEMILNAGQQKNLFDIANSGGLGGEVRFEIDGDKLVGVLNRHNRKLNSYR